MRTTLVTGLLVQTVCFFACSANATEINVVPKSTGEVWGTITHTNPVTPTNTVPDAARTLKIAGGLDDNKVTERTLVLMERYSQRRIFDSNTSNDLFSFSNDDYSGNQNNVLTNSGEAIITQADRATVKTDGFVNITFELSDGVNSYTAPQAFTAGEMQFTSVRKKSSSLAMFGISAVGL
ncbi:MAG: hypothetical protein CMJ81_06590 [Planctomycetaceae bacterium]|nr:hypothetical protein [Planctomycetaceae bacterium]MBP63110.1 hypothetical protein [Planctomycetaceae bacterium]